MRLAGGELALADRLGLPIGQIQNWLEGIEPMTDAAFMKVLDVVIYATPPYDRH
jgi:hypothetical protein